MNHYNMEKVQYNNKANSFLRNKAFRFLYIPFLVLTLTLTFIILSVKFTVLFKPLYYMDIDYLNIEKMSSLSRSEIIQNYDYVVNYVMSPSAGTFKLPTLPFSEKGKIHFEEVQNIFTMLDYLLIFCAGFSILGVLIEIRHKNLRFLKWSAFLLLFLPLALSLPFLINFDRSFTLFHKLFFRNDYWLFDIKADPIINMLPQTFFYHAALLILGLLLLFSILLLILYTYSKRRWIYD